jgi:hypothetical protein
MFHLSNAPTEGSENNAIIVSVSMRSDQLWWLSLRVLMPIRLTHFLVEIHTTSSLSAYGESLCNP